MRRTVAHFGVISIIAIGFCALGWAQSHNPVGRRTSSVAAKSAHGGSANAKISSKTREKTSVPENDHEKKEGESKDSTKDKVARKSIAEEAAALVGALRSTIGDLFLLALLLSFTLTMIREVRHTMVLVDPIEVPQDLAEKGYSAQVVAQHLASGMNALRGEANRQARFEEGYEISGSQIDFTVPSTGISFRSIIQYTRQLFRRPNELLRGEVVRFDSAAADAGGLVRISEKLRLTIRSRMRGQASFIADADSDLATLLHDAAIAVASVVDPYLVADVWFAREQRDQASSFSKTIEAAQHCLARTRPNQHYRAYVIWANALVIRRDFEAARKKYVYALRLAPRSSQPCNGLGNIQRAIRRYDEAGGLYWRGILHKPSAAYIWSNLGYSYGDRKKYRCSLIAFGCAMRLDRSFVPAYAGRGYILWRMGRHDDAQEVLERARDLSPSYGWTHLQVARVLESEGKLDQSIEHLQLALRGGVAKAESYSVWGDILRRTGRFAEAEEKYEQADRAAPHRAIGRVGVARSRLDQGRYFEVINICRDAWRIDQYYPEALQSWAHALASLRHDDQALKKYREVLELDPYYVDAHVGAGNVLRLQNRPRLAIARFWQATARDSRNSWAQRSWCTALFDICDYQGALVHVKKALAIDERDSSAHIWCGKVLAALGDRNAALVQFQRACELDSRSRSAWQFQAGTLIELGRGAEGLALLVDAVAAQPREAQLRLPLADLLWRRGRYEEARDQWKIAESLQPRDVTVLRALAQMWMRSFWRRYEALGILRRALIEAPRAEDTRLEVAELLCRMGRFDHALDWCAVAHRRTPRNVATLIKWAKILRRRSFVGPLLSPAEQVWLQRESENRVRQAVEITPWNPGPLQEWGFILYESRRLDEASAKFAAATSLDPRNARSWMGWGDSLRGIRKYGAALGKYEHALALEPWNASALVSCGKCHEGLGDRDEALGCYRRACDLDVFNVWAWQSFAGLQDVETAITTLKGALAAHPEATELHIVLARARLRQNRPHDALEHIEIAASKAPPSVNMLRTWADVLLAIPNGHEQALKPLTRALMFEPWNEEVVAEFGLALTRIGQHDLAARWFEGSHNRQPESGRILKAWALALRIESRRQSAAAVATMLLREAEKKLQEATSINRWDSEAWQDWAYLLRDLGRAKEAEAKLRQASAIQ